MSEQEEMLLAQEGDEKEFIRYVSFTSRSESKTAYISQLNTLYVLMQ